MKQFRKGLTTGLTALLLVTAQHVSLAAPQKSGIQGQVFLIISYGRPTEVEPGIWVGIPQLQLPLGTTINVLSTKTGRHVHRITTDANGIFAVSLPPGRYLLAPDTLRFPWGCSVATLPIEVTVHPRQFTTANIFYFQEGPCSVVGTMP